MATETSLKVRLLNASKTHAEWTSADPVLKKGEIAYSSDKKQIRVGDGSSKWSQLSYIDANHIVGFSNSGSTITYTKADGSTGTITLPEYDIATSSTPGLVKSGGNITVASDGSVTVNTATKANQVSGTAGSVNADRHVWFSDSVTETVRNYDDDFKYNPNTNTLKVTKIDGVELTGTPKAPTAASGTNSTQIATTAFVQNAVGNAEIGGRNLVKDSHKVVSNDSYATADYYFGDDPPLNGEEVTIQIKGKLADTKSYWNLYNSGGSMNCFAVEKERYDATTGIYTDTGTWRVGTAGNTFMRIYAFTSSQSGTSTIEWVKLERGNKPTDWTPAPEDLVSDITLSGTTLSYKNPVGTQLGSYTLSKSNVGLGNVDNTSDANKPISTATQNALDQLSAKVGNAKQFTGTCSSAADATAKVVTCTAFTADDLVKGTRISVYFDNTNSGARTSLTLNVNNTGAKSIQYIYNGTYESIPGNNYIKAGQIYNFTYDGTYWVVDMMCNSNTYPEYLSYRNNTYAKKAIAANKWIVGDKDGYEEIASGVTFDLSYPILYTSGAVSQGSSNYANMFMQYYDLNLGNLKSGFTSSAKKMIYLVVTISGNTATVDSSIITDTLPTSDDGKAYITLGRLGNQSSGANYFLFQAVHPIFVYKKGQIRLYSGSADIVNGHTVEADIPSNAVFTDTKVTQTLSSTNANYPLILGKNTTSTTTNYTDTVLRNNSIYANPSTGMLTAPILQSTNYIKNKRKIYNIAQGVFSTQVSECILYTGFKINSNDMVEIHVTGYLYGSATPIDILVNVYLYSSTTKLYNVGGINVGGIDTDAYLYQYTKNSVNYLALGLHFPSVIYYPILSADIAVNESSNMDISMFQWAYTEKDAESVIPTPDNGVTCIQVPYKTNYNPKPTLTIQGNSTNIGTYNGAEAATINITKSSIGLGNVENKSSATIRGELTSSNVTTALGYTPVANNTTAYVYYGGNDTGLGSGTTAANAKTYFSDASKVPAGMVKFFYNNSGTEYTTVFSKAPGSSYGSVLKWGYGDRYLRILRNQASTWKSDDWEKIDAGYADSAGSAGHTTNLRYSIIDASNNNIDDLLLGTDLTFSRVTHANIGWASNDGLILSIPYSTAYGRQIALDDNNNWMATRAKNNTSGWTAWDRILTKSYGDTLYLSKTDTHAHTVMDLSFGTKGLAGSLDPITAYNIGPSASNKTFGLPAEAITVEYSTDAGATWQDYGLSDYGKKALFAETREQWIYAGKNSTSGQGSTNYWLRVTIYPSDGRYAYINGLYLWVNRAGVTATVDLQRSTRGNPDTFTEVFSGQDIAGWSGNNIRYFSSNSFGGSTGQTSNGYKYRMIFKITSITDANYGTLSVSDIRFLGSSVFSYPSGNYMMKHNRLYNWDADLNAVFPAKLIAPIIQTGTDSTSYFQSQKFRGQGNANTYYHAIDFGYDGHNQVDFYEYGGIYNFWKNTGSGTSTAALLGKITTNGWEGNVVGNVTGNATTATTANEAKALITLGDKRSVATTPNDYKNNIVFAGLKNKATINSPSNNTYSYIVGLRGWADSSGGKAHEIAFNDTGIFTRMGATTEWESWRQLLDSVNYSSYALSLTGGTLSGNLLFNQDVRGSRFPAHYYHNLYNDTDGTVYIHYYIPGTSHTNTKAEFRVKSGDTYKRLTFSGDGSFYWDTQIVLHAGNYMNYALPLAGGTLTGDLTLSASSGNSPAIIFQRGSLTDSLNDWEIRDKSGFLYFGQRGSNSTAFDTSIYLDNSGGIHATTFSGSLTGHASLDLPLTAGSSVPLSNSLYITKAGECGVEVNNTQSTNPNQVAFIVGSSGNGGIYSRKHNKWIVYADSSGNVVLNGNAVTASSASTATIANYLSIVASNEIRFAGKPSSATTIHVGYKWHDGTSDAKILRYKFCNGNGVATQVEASTFYGALTGNVTGNVTGTASGNVPLKSSPSDLNTIYDTSVTNITGSLTNGPTTYGYGEVFTMAYRKPSGNTTPDYAAQIYMHYNTSTTKNTMYYRTSSQTAWNDWQQVAHAAPQTALGSVTQPIYMESDGTLKVASQVAELDSNGLILSSQLPSYVDDVIEAYYYNSKMYKEAAHTTALTGESSKIYVDLSTNKTYRWSGSAYVEISASLALGENSSTAYRGDRGKIAYDHSQTTSGNPHNVTKTDIGLSNVENKSSATIRGELTSSNVTTALGYTPVPNTRQINGKALTGNIILEMNDINPIGGGTKTYAGLYGSANDAAGASFYFASVKPDNYYGIWKVKYRIKVDVPNQNNYHGYADVEIYGNTNTYTAYSIFNSHLSTSYRTFYFHNLYRATETGSSAYGHLLGIGLRASANPTSSSYPRTVRVEMLEAENCTVTMFDDALKYANVPGTGSTNYAGLSEFDGYSNGLRETGDDNDTYTVRDYYTRLTAGTNGMKQYSLVMQDASGTWQSFTTDYGNGAEKTKNTVGFQLGKIYYMSMGGNVASGAQCGDNIVTSHAISIDLRYSTNCASTLTAYKPIYIKGTFDVSTGLFYLADTWWTEELPDHPDGFIYKQIGYTRSAYYIDFSNTLPTYWYHDGAIREFVMPIATPFVAGLLSSGDKIKLDTIETGANKCIALTYAEIDAILAT